MVRTLYHDRQEDLEVDERMIVGNLLHVNLGPSVISFEMSDFEAQSKIETFSLSRWIVICQWKKTTSKKKKKKNYVVPGQWLGFLRRHRRNIH